MIKNEVLHLLEKSNGEYLSGSRIADLLGVSRTAVWKAVCALEKEGYLFEKSTRNGYKLKGSKALSLYGVKKYLKNTDVREVEFFEEITSTNTYLMERGAKGEKEGLLVVAKRQTSGRGRRGKTFFSPNGGAYFSLLLRPQKDYVGTSYLTVMTALAVMDAIRETYGVEAGIKWVNDVYIGSKKVAGILTEASFDYESGAVSHVVIGVGINLEKPKGGFPKEIKNIACALEKEIDDGANKLIATAVNNLMENVRRFEKDQSFIMARYRESSVILGRKIMVIRDGIEAPAVAHAITDEGHLIVRYPFGEEEELYFGEVSLCLNE